MVRGFALVQRNTQPSRFKNSTSSCGVSARLAPEVSQHDLACGSRFQRLLALGVASAVGVVIVLVTFQEGALLGQTLGEVLAFSPWAGPLDIATARAERVAEKLAAKLGVVLETQRSGRPLLLGMGSYGRTYAVTGGLALKVQEQMDSGDPVMVLDANLPDTPALLRGLNITCVQDNVTITGQLLLRSPDSVITSCKFQTQTHGPLMRTATTLALRFGIKLEMDAGLPLLLLMGSLGCVFAVEGGLVLRMHDEHGCAGPQVAHDHFLSPLLRPLDQVEVHLDTTFMGLLMRRLDGMSLEKYVKNMNPFISGELGLRVAANLAVAVHALHTKIRGYVVLHCDLNPQNVMVSWSAPGDADSTVLFDYGLALVHKLRPGETVADPIFSRGPRSDRCRGTDWGNFFHSRKSPFPATVEWRELGILLYTMMACSDLDYNYVYDRLFASRNDHCDYRCAASRAIDDAVQIRGPLRDLVRYLILNHESVRNEAVDVLGHAAFAGLRGEESPARRAARIEAVEVSAEFARLCDGGGGACV